LALTANWLAEPIRFMQILHSFPLLGIIFFKKPTKSQQANKPTGKIAILGKSKNEGESAKFRNSCR
jgi:hypothetical protein